MLAAQKMHVHVNTHTYTKTHTHTHMRMLDVIDDATLVRKISAAQRGRCARNMLQWIVMYYYYVTDDTLLVRRIPAARNMCPSKE